MRYLITAVIAVAVVGCASQPPSQEAAAAHRHAANIAAAADAGYKVTVKNDQTLFCPIRAPIGSRIATCLTERQWELEQASVFYWKAFSAPEPFTVATREGY